MRQLDGYGSRTIVPKKTFGNRDLAALSAATGDEFALFTRSGQRMIIRGNAKTVPVTPEMARGLGAQGWRWSGHVHPNFSMISSEGDRAVLGAMGGRQSAIYDPYARYRLFSPKGDSWN
jgi:hypothetical protein